MNLAEINDTEDENDEDAMTNQYPTMLPKPVRMFSYVFFGIVVIVGLLGWMMTQH
jgi:hypothetical protein